MIPDGEGKGRLAPVGKLGAAIDVTYKPSHEWMEANTSMGTAKRRVAQIDSITCESGDNAASR